MASSLLAGMRSAPAFPMHIPMLAACAIAAFTAFTAFAAAPARAQTVASAPTELDVQQRRGSDASCELAIGERIIHRVACAESFDLRLLGDYAPLQGRYPRVLVFQEVPRGNACNGGPLHFVGLGPDGQHRVTGPLDYCGGRDPVLLQELDAVLVTLPGGTVNRGAGSIATARWRYRSGALIQVNETPRSTRR